MKNPKNIHTKSVHLLTVNTIIYLIYNNRLRHFAPTVLRIGVLGIYSCFLNNSCGWEFFLFVRGEGCIIAIGKIRFSVLKLYWIKLWICTNRLNYKNVIKTLDFDIFVWYHIILILILILYTFSSQRQGKKINNLIVNLKGILYIFNKLL